MWVCLRKVRLGRSSGGLVCGVARQRVFSGRLPVVRAAADADRPVANLWRLLGGVSGAAGSGLREMRLAECAGDIGCCGVEFVGGDSRRNRGRARRRIGVANESSGRMRLNRRGATRRFEGVGSSDFVIEARED